MLKVLIVDDEFLLRRLINVSVDWRSLGFKVVGEAEDGEEAIEKINMLHPDLMIIDINIPFINGIQVSLKVRELFPEIKIVILTGYDEFEYARGAIRAGVFRYLLKPINAEELREALVALREEIQKETLQRDYVERLENETRKSFEFKRQQILNDLIAGNLGGCNDEVQDLLKNHNVHVGQSNHRVIVIEMEECADRLKDQELLQKGIYTICSDIFSKVSKICIFVKENSIICILGNDLADDHKKLSLELIRKVKEYLNCTISIGIGDCYDGYEKICLSYQEAASALNRRFKEGKGKIFENMTTNFNPIKQVFHINTQDHILLYLRRGDYELLTKEIGSFFDDARTNELDKETIQFLAMEMITVFGTFLIENNLDLNEIWGNDENYIELIKRHETLSSLRHFIIEFLQKTILLINKRNTKMSNIVVKAKEYIEHHYSNEDLSLDEIAEHIGVNSSYLSSLFKKEFKTNIIEYITKIRLTKAKELMDQNIHIPFSKVSELVGYSEPYYFSKCFKKRFGVTPTQYVQMKT